MLAQGILRLPQKMGRSALLKQAGFIGLAFLVYAIIVICFNQPVFAVFGDLLTGAFGSNYAITNTITKASPLLLTALCTLIPARLGLVVIGNQGALLIGGLAAASFGLLLPPALGAFGIIINLLISFIFGGIWVGLVGLLYATRKIDPTISSLLFYYIAWSLFQFLVEGPLRDPSSLNKPSTPQLPAEFKIGSFSDSGIHIGLLVGIAFLIITYIIINHTKLGFKIRITGGNDRVAASLGFPRHLFIIGACFLGGGFAGLAGGFEIHAIQGQANSALNGTYGTTGILVAFLARQHPLFVIPASLLIGGLIAGGDLVNRHFPAIPIDLSFVLQGLLFIAIILGEAVSKTAGGKK